MPSLMCLGLVLLAACSSSTTAAQASPTSTWATQASTGPGGISALVAAAKAEGQLNVIGLPPDWANYGKLMDGFQAKYGIKINASNPNAISQDEIDAMTKAGKSRSAPDVLDLNMTVALANALEFAPYKVLTWDSIPSAQKNDDGMWYQDYGGYMSVGYDTAKLPAVTRFEDLLLKQFKGKVAIAGDPLVDDTALAAVMTVALSEGGSLDNIAPGVAFFHALKLKGNFQPAHATQASVKAGSTPVTMEWEFISRSHFDDVPTWKVVIPGFSPLGVFYAQAINKNAPHPAAARLWEEYLYSVDGQNQWLKAGLRPVELEALQNAGTADSDGLAALPASTGTAQFIAPSQLDAARKYLVANWVKAVG
jgi:putative spermidine/putrescine transport system substrate-binding protein